MTQYRFSRAEGWKTCESALGDDPESIEAKFRCVETYGKEYGARAEVYARIDPTEPSPGFHFYVEVWFGESFESVITCAELPDLLPLVAELRQTIRDAQFVSAPSGLVDGKGAPVVAFEVFDEVLWPVVGGPHPDMHASPTRQGDAPVRQA